MEVLSYNLVDRFAVKVSTTDLGISWKKFCARVKNPLTYCSYETNTDGELSLYDYDLQKTQLIPKEQWKETRPVFFETNSYSFVIHFYNLKEGQRPNIIHPKSQVKEMFNYYKGDSLLAGTINFLNEPGTFQLRFSYVTDDDKTHEDFLNFIVVSPKLDTKNDLNILIQQIRNEYDNLVFRYLSLTFRQYEQGNKSSNDLIWLSIFKDIIDGYLNALRFITNRPHMRYVRTEEYSRPEHIKRWSNELAMKFFHDRHVDEQKALRNYYRNEQTDSTVDTRENRFVKFTISEISRRLNSIVSRITAISGGKVSEEEICNLRDKQNELQMIKSSSLFRTVGKFDGFKQESLVLQQRTGYAQIYRYWIMLQNGLDLVDGKTAIGLLPIWQLYEVWCFLKMKRLVCKILDLDPMNKDDLKYIHESKKTMFNPFAESGLSDCVKYDNKKNGDVVELGYQYKFDLNSERDNMRSFTVEQKPDIVMNIHTKDTGFVLTYLFDAKYRVEGDDNPDTNKTLYDNPVQDTLNQMHRYRDAIYYENPKQNCRTKEVIGAYILFPGRLANESAVVENLNAGNYKDLPNYLKSIIDVNIGAFPLLPNDNSGILLDNHLSKLINGQLAVKQIVDSSPQRGLNYTVIPQNTDDIVLIGCIRSEAQLEWIKTHSWYNIRLLVKGHERPGAQANDINLMLVKHVILYRLNTTKDSTEIIGCYAMKSNNFAPMFFDYNDMQKSNYPFKENADSFSRYLVYEIKDSPISTSDLDRINEYTKKKVTEQSDEEKGAPIIVASEDLNVSF